MLSVKLLYLYVHAITCSMQMELMHFTLLDLRKNFTEEISDSSSVLLSFRFDGDICCFLPCLVVLQHHH